MAEASLYDLLGVPPTAEPAELKKAYHHQCLKWHPDKHQGSAESRRRANNIFQRVTNAYEVLGAEAVEGALGLTSLKRTAPAKVASTSAVDGRGLEPALQWLSDFILRRGNAADPSKIKVERT